MTGWQVCAIAVLNTSTRQLTPIVVVKPNWAELSPIADCICNHVYKQKITNCQKQTMKKTLSLRTFGRPTRNVSSSNKTSAIVKKMMEEFIIIIVIYSGFCFTLSNKSKSVFYLVNSNLKMFNTIFYMLVLWTCK